MASWNNLAELNKRVLLPRAPTSTQLQSTPSSSFQPPKKSKLSVFPQNWHIWYSRMLIFIPTLVFWISKPRSIFEQIWAEKVKVIHFGWWLVHRVSRRCWFLFRHYFSEFSNPIHFWVNLGRKIQSCPFWLKISTCIIWHTWMLILIPTLVFWISDPKSIFGKI